MTVKELIIKIGELSIEEIWQGLLDSCGWFVLIFVCVAAVSLLFFGGRNH